MFHVDNNSGVANMPELAPAQSNTTTWFTEGDGQKGISWIGQDWLNILQAELLNILAEASIQPDKAQLNQLTLSIKAIIAANAFSRKNNLKEIADAGAEAQRL
ncbi:phage tail protein, partial [Escherichia coli]